jgi:3-dehydroquinate synthase
VAVPLGARAYEILIGPGLLGAAGEMIRPLLRRPRVAVLTDTNVRDLHGATLAAGLAGAGVAHGLLALPPGEPSKGWRGLERAVEWLIEERVARDDVVVAFGGGVIGDLAGFAAAVLRRGVRFVQIPTTLLAQVDSSVGGKTGINSVAGKNLVGAFHQPSLVLADTDLLDTLPRRELLAGYAEVAKYGLLGDRAFFDWLEGNAAALAAGEPAARIHAIRRSCEMKAEIVVRDETEQGDRALLNLGHTFGHALEAATGYSARLLHGEAVAIGCCLAFETSRRLGLCSADDALRVRRHFQDVGLPVDLAAVPGSLPDAAALVALMGQDKKVRDGRIAFVLARGIGAAFVAPEVDLAVVAGVLADSRAARP